MDSITVKGQQFEIPSRYVEGHELSAGEAAKLQREYKKVLDVWLRKKMKNGVGGDDLQGELDAYASRYQFGVRVGGGARRPKDAVEIKALEIAQRHVREQFKAAGGKLKDLKIGKINSIARAWVGDADRGYLDLARKELKKPQAQQVVDPDIEALL